MTPLLVFVVGPLLDLYLLYRLGKAWGLLAALALMLGTGGLGLAIVRGQGTRILAAAGGALAGGRPPDRPVLEAIAKLGGGLLLIAPGPITDGLGLLLLLPPTRRLLLRLGRHWIERMAARGLLRVAVLRWPASAGRAESDEETPLGLDPAHEIRLPPRGGGD